MCSLVLFGALNIGDIRDTAEISLKQAACMELVSPGVAGRREGKKKKKEKQRKTALNERGSWRLCWLINEQHTLKSFCSSCTSFAHFLLHVTFSGYESSASGACLQGKGYTWKDGCTYWREMKTFTNVLEEPGRVQMGNMIWRILQSNENNNKKKNSGWSRNTFPMCQGNSNAHTPTTALPGKYILP